MTLRKVAIGLAVVAVAAGLAAFGAVLFAQDWATRQVDAALAQQPITKASHGAITYSPWRGHLEIEDLAVETSWPELQSLHAGHLEVDGIGPFDFTGLGGGGVSIAAIRAEQVELLEQQGHQSFGGISMTGLSWKGGKAVDAQSPHEERIAAILARFSIKRLEARNIHQWTDRPSRDARVDSFAADDFAAGRFGNLLIGKFVSVFDDPTKPGAGEKIHAEVAEIRAAGLDLAAWSHASAVPSQDASVIPLIDGLAFAGLGIANGETTISIEAVSIGGLRTRADAVPRQGASPEQLMAFYRAMSLDRLEITNLAATTPPARMTLGRLGVDKLQAGHVERLGLDNFAVAAKEGRGRLGSLELDGLAYDLGDIPNKVSQVFVSRLRLADMAGGTTAGADISVKEMLLTMNGNAARPTGMSVKIKAVEIPATVMPQLRLVGYQKLLFDGDTESTYDPERAIFGSTWMLTAPGVGTLDLSMRFSNYPIELESRDVAYLVKRFSEARLDHVEVRYDDASLVDRLFGVYAAQLHSDVAAVRGQMIALAETQRSAAAGNPAMSASLDSIIAFLRKPGMITLDVTPPQPVAFRDLLALSPKEPAAAAALLGLSIH